LTVNWSLFTLKDVQAYFPFKGGDMAATPERSADEQMVQEGFADVAEAQRFLGGLSRATIYNMMDARELPYAKFGRRRMIPWHALHQYAARSLVVR
jgi:excisionase family DNA binding protein